MLTEIREIRVQKSSQPVSPKKLMGWDFFFVYSHHFSPPSALSSHLAYTFSSPNTLPRIPLRMPTEQ